VVYNEFILESCDIRYNSLSFADFKCLQ